MTRNMRSSAVAVAELPEPDTLTVGMAAPAAVEMPNAKVSESRIIELQSTFSDLSSKLKAAREFEQELRGMVREVAEKEERAKRLLQLTEEISGFARDRERAAEVLEHCLDQRRDLEPRVEGNARQIKQLEESLAEIDKSWFQKVEEIRRLVRDLK